MRFCVILVKLQVLWNSWTKSQSSEGWKHRLRGQMWVDLDWLPNKIMNIFYKLHFCWQIFLKIEFNFLPRYLVISFCFCFFNTIFYVCTLTTYKHLCENLGFLTKKNGKICTIQDRIILFYAPESCKFFPFCRHKCTTYCFITQIPDFLHCKLLQFTYKWDN